jgi:hypothetical protein
MLNLTVHIVTTGFYRFTSLLLTDHIKLLSLSVSFAVARFCLCRYEEDLAFGDRTAPTLLIFSYTFLSITATRNEKDSHSSVRKFWSQFSTWKSYKLAVFSDGKLVSLKVLFSVRHVSAARLVIFLSSVLLFCQVLLLAQKAQLAGVTYRWHNQLEIRTFWFAGIEWVIRVHILHAHVRACYTFRRPITARGFVLTDRHTVCWRYLSVCRYFCILVSSCTSQIALSLLVPVVSSSCQHSSAHIYWKGRFRSHKIQDSVTEERPVSTPKSWDCHFEIPVGFTPVLYLYEPTAATGRHLRLQNTLLNVSALRIRRPFEATNMCVPRRRLEGDRPVARRVLTQDNTNRWKNLSVLEIEPTIQVFGQHNSAVQSATDELCQLSV